MRYSFHRICSPCPKRLPELCSKASDELINIIKASLPHHFLPAKTGGLETYRKLSGRPGGGWHWKANQTWCIKTVKYKKRRWKKRGKEKKRGSRQFPHSRTQNLFGSAFFCQVCFREIGIHRQFFPHCGRVVLWWLAARGDEICCDCSESYLACPWVTGFLHSTLLFTGWHALWQATSRGGFQRVKTISKQNRNTMQQYGQNQLK